MMARTMSFKELMFRIHPDHNPDVEDAGGKMNQAMLVKNQPEELYKLAVRWRVTDLHRPQPQHTPKPESKVNMKTDTYRPQTQPRFRWVEYINDEPQVGDTVRVRTRGNAQVQVIGTTDKRVYFYQNGDSHYSLKRCVVVVRWEMK